MKVFVLNAGSSSVKAAYFDDVSWAQAAPEPVWSGEIRWSRLPAHAQLGWTAGSASGSANVDVSEHSGGARAIVQAASDRGIRPDAVGHRVVHGLSESRCTRIDARVRGVIEAASELAPLHNRAALAGIDSVTSCGREYRKRPTSTPPFTPHSLRRSPPTPCLTIGSRRAASGATASTALATAIVPGAQLSCWRWILALCA